MTAASQHRAMRTNRKTGIQNEIHLQRRKEEKITEKGNKELTEDR
jgi:hypothetical protein